MSGTVTTKRRFLIVPVMALRTTITQQRQPPLPHRRLQNPPPIRSRESSLSNHPPSATIRPWLPILPLPIGKLIRQTISIHHAAPANRPTRRVKPRQLLPPDPRPAPAQLPAIATISNRCRAPRLTSPPPPPISISARRWPAISLLLRQCPASSPP